MRALVSPSLELRRPVMSDPRHIALNERSDIYATMNADRSPAKSKQKAHRPAKNNPEITLRVCRKNISFVTAVLTCKHSEHLSRPPDSKLLLASQRFAWTIPVSARDSGQRIFRPDVRLLIIPARNFRTHSSQRLSRNPRRRLVLRSSHHRRAISYVLHLLHALHHAIVEIHRRPRNPPSRTRIRRAKGGARPRGSTRSH